MPFWVSVRNIVVDFVCSVNQTECIGSECASKLNFNAMCHWFSVVRCPLHCNIFVSCLHNL